MINAARMATNDLAYMIAVHWYPERRGRMEGSLLGDYYSGMASVITSADLQDDYRLSVLWQTVTPVFQAGLQLPP